MTKVAKNYILTIYEIFYPFDRWLILIHYRILFFVLFLITITNVTFSSDDGTMGTIYTDEKVVTSCTLSIKVSTVQSIESAAPKALVEVFLLNKDGEPISGGQIGLTATAGTFICNEINMDDKTCFFSGPDGKAKITLINIPYNSPVKIKASYNCGDYDVYATGNLLLTKRTTRKK